MKLNEYLQKNKLTQVEFAKIIGVTKPVISRIVNRKKNVSIQVIKRIEEATKGEVQFSDIYLEIESKRIKKKYEILTK